VALYALQVIVAMRMYEDVTALAQRLLVMMCTILYLDYFDNFFAMESPCLQCLDAIATLKSGSIASLELSRLD
jgi:hypothetical protein